MKILRDVIGKLVYQNAEVVELAVVDEERVNPDSARIVADLAAKVYADEVDRTKSLEGKAGPTIAATSAALIFAAGNLTRAPQSMGLISLVVYFAVLAVGVLLLFLAQGCFLMTLRVVDFRRMSVGQWARYSVMKLPPEELYTQLASSYEDVVDFNTVLNNRKAVYYARGLRLLTVGIFFLAVLLVWASLVNGGIF